MPIDQGQANITTVGHFDPYLTHSLVATDQQAEQPHSQFELAAEVATFLAVSESWEQDHPGSTIQFSGSTLKRSPDSAGRNPYLNIRVDGELIPDHNDIYDPRIESFIRQLILVSSQTTQLDERKLQRSKALTPQ